MGIDLTDDDVECNEGRQIVFVDPRPGRRARPHRLGRDRTAAVHRVRALPPDPEHPGVHARRGTERLTRDRQARLHRVAPGVPARAVAARPSGVRRRAPAPGRHSAAGRSPSGAGPAPSRAGTAGWPPPGTGDGAAAARAGRCAAPAAPRQRTDPEAPRRAVGAARRRSPEHRRRGAVRSGRRGRRRGPAPGRRGVHRRSRRRGGPTQVEAGAIPSRAVSSGRTRTRRTFRYTQLMARTYVRGHPARTRFSSLGSVDELPGDPGPRVRRRGRRGRQRRGRTRARSSPAPRTAASSGSPTTAASIDRVAQTGGRPLGIEIDLDGRLLVCDAHRGVLRVDTAHRRGRAGHRQRRRAEDGVLQQRRDRGPTARSGSPTPPRSTASSSGRTTSSRTPAPGGCCGSAPTARSRSSSTGWPSPTGWRSRATRTSSPWPSPARAPSSAAG